MYDPESAEMGLTREPPLVSNERVCNVGVDDEEEDSSDELDEELSLEEELSEETSEFEEVSELEDASLEEDSLVVLDSSDDETLSEDVLVSQALRSNTKVSPKKWNSREGLFPINISRFQSRTTDDDKKRMKKVTFSLYHRQI